MQHNTQQVLDWFNKNFLYGLGEDAVLSPTLHAAYMSLRTRTPLLITVEPSQHGMVRGCQGLEMVRGYQGLEMVRGCRLSGARNGKGVEMVRWLEMVGVARD